jgi:hypothetical protein
MAAGLLAGARAEAQSCATPATGVAIAAMRALNREYIDAARTGDASWFERHMADDLLVISGNGTRFRKPDFVAMVRNTPASFTSLVARDVNVRVFGATAQVDADAPWERTDGSKGTSRYIDTYAWIGCRWQVISAQITLIPQPGLRGRRRRSISMSRSNTGSVPRTCRVPEALFRPRNAGTVPAVRRAQACRAAR